MLEITLIAVAVVVAAVLLLAARRPDHFRVERSIRINARQEQIWPFINSLQRFAEWSPFEKEGIRRQFSGPPAGPGATYDFQGPSSVGTGRCAITGSSPPNRVAMKLDMKKPIEAHNDIEFTLEPEGGHTRVTWAMWGRNGFVPKLMGLFMDMNGLCGREFEKGLATLQERVEGERSGAGFTAQDFFRSAS